MRPIKRKTYYNFMRVVRMIQAKGYDFYTASTLAHQKFEQYEHNPKGLPILTMIDMILPAEEYIETYK